MLLLVGAVLFDLGDEGLVTWPPRADRGQHSIESRVAAVLVVDVDRAQHVEIAIAQRRQHESDGRTPRPPRQSPIRRSSPWSSSELPRLQLRAPAQSA